MRRWMAVCLIVAGSFALARTNVAQDQVKQEAAAKKSAPAHYFHLKFVIQEVDAAGKPTNSRVYTSTVNTDPEESSSIRVGSRIPIATGPNQFQYIDLGVNIDARNAREIDGKLSLDIKADITSQGDAVEVSSARQPVIRQNKWQSVVLIPVDKPTVVFTSDALDTKGSLQMVVTATSVP